MTNRSSHDTADGAADAAASQPPGWHLYCALCLTVAGGLVGIIGCSDTGLFDGQSPGVAKYISGVQACNAGDRAAAIASFNEAIQINPSLRMAHIRLASLYRQQGDYAKAADQYQIAAQLDPYSAENAYNLGVCYQLLHRLADAAAAYLRALDLQPANAQANMNLGLVYLALGHSNDAVTYLQRATQIDPNSSQAWSNFGVGLDAVGRLFDGERAYERSLELNTGSPATLENLAANLIAQRKAHEALAVCQQLILRTDTGIARTRYGQALALSGRKDEAMEQYQLALRRDPQSYLAMTQEAFLLIDEYRAGMELDEPKREAAITLWHSSLRLNPNQPRVTAAMQQWQSAQLFGK